MEHGGAKLEIEYASAQIAIARSLDYNHRISGFKQVAAEAHRLAGNKLVDVLLFGSTARGDFTPDSDVDICVVLDYTENEFIGKIKHDFEQSLLELVVELELELDICMMPLIIPKAKLDMGKAAVYRNIKREGISWQSLRS